MRIILHRIVLPVTLCTVKRDQCGQGERQASGQRARGPHPRQQLRQNARAILGHAVKRNRQQLMLDIRIAETTRDGAGERRQFITRQIQDRNDFLIDRFFDKRAYVGIVHRLAHRIQSRLERHRHQRRVRAVENCHFALFVRLNVIHNPHV